MAPRPPYTSAQPPPELPADPKLSEMTSQYLRTFALWCRNGFAAKLDANRALPGVMIQAVDATSGLPINAVYMLTIKATAGPPPSAPTIVMTLMPSGSGSP
jgi:hypothetical protein